jgi:hypothetical protein
MNWQRLIVFVVLLWLAPKVVAFLFEFNQGLLEAKGMDAPEWLRLGQVAAVFLASLVVLAEFARRQSERPWEHAAALVLLGWLANLPNVLFFGLPILAWLIQLPVFGSCLLIAVPIGKRLRS